MYRILWLLFIPEIALGATLNYYISSNFHTPDKISAIANTAKLGEFVLQEPRSLPTEKVTIFPVVYCINSATKLAIVYGRKYKCEHISWTLNAKKISGLTVDVSAQKNIYSTAGWWVLFEWNAIPRINKDVSINVCALVENSDKAANCQLLPTIEQPPLIMPWGKLSYQKQQLNLLVDIYFDGDKSFFGDNDWDNLAKQFAYINGLFKQKKNMTLIELILVGIDSKLGRIGGAAGKRALIANYVTSNKQVLPDTKQRLHWISGHEIFHILSRHNYPLWIEESLAQYYGYKSLRQIGMDTESPLSLWQSGKNSTPHAEVGLYKAQSSFIKTKDMSYYPLFYNKGAAFWQALDQLLIEQGASLDTELSIIVNLEDSTKLSNEFSYRIQSVIGNDNYQFLVAEYLN